ncbi:MAG: phosphoglucomutase [Flavobacteriaceae bacterium TMED184]|nr:MAG: phosphoglucomutase [Flavobacteriaceae bacterium TMED184]
MFKSKAKKWCSKPFDIETQKAVSELFHSPKKLEEAFYKDIEFGTGGIRGLIGVGTNRINKYTLGRCAQGLSNYLNKNIKKRAIKTVIAFDSRLNSKKWANQIADIFSANEIYCYIFSDLRTTPELSFAVRYLNASCGIVITASHNPAEYNGFKVYSKDGGQIVPPEDNNIIQSVNKVDFSEINFKRNSNLIEIIDKKIDEQFYKSTIDVAKFDSSLNKDLKVIFTPLHGASITAIPNVLKMSGFNNVFLVKEQAEPNGNFPTIKSPNPEEPEAFKIAIKQAKKNDGGIIIATDADGDRLGVSIKDENQNFYLLNGNQIMVVIIYFLLEHWKKRGKLNGNQFIATTIVSTPMIKKIASEYNVAYKETLTGFKWISKLIEDFPDLEFIAGGEESHGYLIGEKVRDKDAISAALLICEIENQMRKIGKSTYELLLECYKKFGAHKERLISFVKKGKEGINQIDRKMNSFRKSPPKFIDGIPIIQIKDYEKGFSFNLSNKIKTKINLPKSNVLTFILEDNSKISIRPSGTEPKIKFYFSVNQPFINDRKWNATEKEMDEKIDKLIQDLIK